MRTMLLFAAHDPGATNHIRPIYDHALSLGEEAELIDLFSREAAMTQDQAFDLVRAHRPELLIAGCSTNQAEWTLVRACKSLSVKVVVVVDIGAGGKLDAILPAEFPDRFLVTNQGCREEMIGYGADPGAIKLTGSAHIEALARNRRLRRDRPNADGYYGLTSDDNLVPLFCCSYTTDESVKAIHSLATLLPTTLVSRPAIVVRPHPRDPHKERLEAACQRYEHVHYDGGTEVDRKDLLEASFLSFSMASTVSLESLALGTPSAFYQVGWDYAEFDQMYQNSDDVPKIRSREALGRFVTSVLEHREGMIPVDLENSDGALERTWKAISELRERP